MSELLPFIVVGTAIGSLYGLAGLGLVLTYRTSGVFNLAHGALAAASAYLFFELHYTRGWPAALAGLVAVGVFGPFAGLVIERLTRGLVFARQATLIVATVGLMLMIQGFLYWHYGGETVPYPEFLPNDTAFTLSGVIISWSQIIKVGVGVVSFVVLYLFLRSTRLGVAMRAVVAADDLLSLSGTNPAHVRMASWAIGSTFAALSGVLIAPEIGLDAFLLTALVVQAFGAVAIGSFTSLPLSYLGGVVIGILSSIATKYLGERPPLNGIPSVMPFLVLIVVMLITPARKLPKGAGRFSGAASRPLPLPRNVKLGAGLAGTGLLVAIPTVVGPRLPLYGTALVFVILFLSLSLLTRISGQISLAHAAFAGIGAASFSHFSVDSGFPWLVGLFGAALVTGAVGAVLALPAMRLSGLYLALATFGFGLFMQAVVFHTWLLFGSASGGGTGVPGGRTAPRPVLGSLDGNDDKTFYYMVLGIVAVSCLALVALRRARLGRFLRAMADSPTALITMGLGLNTTRVIVFFVSAFFAGAAGALYIAQIGQLHALTFSSTASLLYLVVLTVAGAVSGFVTSAFVAASLLLILPSYLTFMTLDFQQMQFGAVAMLAALVADRQVDVGALVLGAKARLGRVRLAVENAATATEWRVRHSAIRARTAGGETREAS